VTLSGPAPRCRAPAAGNRPPRDRPCRLRVHRRRARRAAPGPRPVPGRAAAPGRGRYRSRARALAERDLDIALISRLGWPALQPATPRSTPPRPAAPHPARPARLWRAVVVVLVQHDVRVLQSRFQPGQRARPPAAGSVTGSERAASFVWSRRRGVNGSLRAAMVWVSPRMAQEFS